MTLVSLPTIAKVLAVLSAGLLLNGLRKKKPYEPRFGIVSRIVFFVTIMVIFFMWVRPAPSAKQALANLQIANASLITKEADFKAAEIAFDQNYTAFISSFSNVEKAYDVKEDLRVVGTLAGQTAALGRQLLEHFEHMKKVGSAYGSAFRTADSSFTDAKAALDYWASEEKAFLDAAESLRDSGTNESYRDLVDGYLSLAEALEIASATRRTSVSHIEMSLQELQATMDYVQSANRFLESVEQHCLTLSEWKSPEVLLSELKKYQTGVTVVGDAIITLKDRVKQEAATKASAESTATTP